MRILVLSMNQEVIFMCTASQLALSLSSIHYLSVDSFKVQFVSLENRSYSFKASAGYMSLGCVILSR